MHWLFKKWQLYRDKRIVTKQLKERDEKLKEMHKVIGEDIPTLIPGPCFHGEIWYRCPHCGKGIEAHSISDTEDNIHMCFYCGNKYFYTRFSR